MLNHRQIEAFRATYETGSITGAAERMNVSQPSVTRLVADLEIALGFSLFRRQRRGMEPTLQAQAFYLQVERSFLGLQDLADAAAEIRGHVQNRISLGLTPAVALAFGPAAIAKFSAHYDASLIETRIGRTEDLLQQIRTGRLSLALIADHIDPGDVQTVLFSRFPYVAILSADHPWAKQDAIDITRMPTKDLIAPPSDFLRSIPGRGPIVEAIINATKIEVDVHFTAAALAKHNMGIALIDPFTAQFFHQDTSLVIRPFTGGADISLPFGGAETTLYLEASPRVRGNRSARASRFYGLAFAKGSRTSKVVPSFPVCLSKRVPSNVCTIF